LALNQFRRYYFLIVAHLFKVNFNLKIFFLGNFGIVINIKTDLLHLENENHFFFQIRASVIISRDRGNYFGFIKFFHDEH